MLSNVENINPVYELLLPKWSNCRVVYGGEDSVHEAGELLLPKLQQQDDSMYEAYKMRARFLPAFKRTVQGVVGTMTRKEPVYNVEGIEDLVNNITGNGTTIQDYVEEVTDEMAIVGICGTLVDHIPVNEELTIAQSESSNIRPNFGLYKAEQIINWKYDTVNNVKVLVMVVLLEYYTDWVNDFTSEIKKQYRVLRLDEDNTYTQQIYRPNAEQGKEICDLVYPKVNGQTIKYIPFYLHGKYENPPLYDLVTTNIKHYQLKADHNHALHYIGLPTPIFPGVDPNDPNKPRAIGPEQIVYLSNPQAKPYYLVYGGEGLASVEKELEELKNDMAFLGAQMLAPADMVAETATKATFRNASETSALALMAKNESSTITEALQFLAVWAGVPEETAKEKIGVDISTDFNPLRLGPQELVSLVQGWQSGAYSKQTLFRNLQEGEIIEGDKSFEEEEEEILLEVPVAPSNPGQLDQEDTEEEETETKDEE